MLRDGADCAEPRPDVRPAAARSASDPLISPRSILEGRPLAFASPDRQMSEHVLGSKRLADNLQPLHVYLHNSKRS